MFIKLSDNAIFRKTAEHEGILINMVTREKVTVNETGFFFLSYVDDTLQDSEEIVTKLSQEISDVSTDIIRNDFMEFMTALKMENMVEMAIIITLPVLILLVKIDLAVVPHKLQVV